MTLIDGVNRCLRAIGEIKVPDGVDLDSLDPLHEAVQIRDIIQEKSRDKQVDGFWFNREDWTFYPHVTTKKITIPVTVLSIQGNNTTVTLQGNNLYDVDNQTLEFDEEQECDTIFERDFESTPQSFAAYVVAEAAVEAQALFKGDSAANKKLEKNLALALISFKREHMRNKSYNLITGSRIIDRSANPTPVGG